MQKKEGFPRKHKIITSILAGILGATGIKYHEQEQSLQNEPSKTYSGVIQRDSPDVFSNPEVDLLYKKLRNGKSINSQELLLLQELKQTIDSISLHGVNDHLLTQKQKDLRYFANVLATRIAFQNFEKEIKNLIRNYSGSKLPVSFADNIRNKDESLDFSQGFPEVDFTKINFSLAQAIPRLSRKYNLNVRLVTAICTIENNFGITKTSDAGAKGMCQTKPEIVKNFYSDYETMSNERRNWAHFETTFKYLNYLKENYNLSINYNDDPQSSKLDFLKAAFMYHSGETTVINNGGRIVDDTEGKRYLLKILDSFNYPVFILADAKGNPYKR